MSPHAFLVAVVFLSCSYVVRCKVLDSCNATIVCTNDNTVCENGICRIQAGQVCTHETTTTTVATTVTTPAQTTAPTGSTQPDTTSQAPSTSSAPTTTEATTTAAPTTTEASTTAAPTTTEATTTAAPTTTEATTTAAPTTTDPTVATDEATTPEPPSRRKRSTDQQECVSNASCLSLVCTCNDGYTVDNGRCKALDPYNGAVSLRGTVLSAAMVTTLMLFLI